MQDSWRSPTRTGNTSARKTPWSCNKYSICKTCNSFLTCALPAGRSLLSLFTGINDGAHKVHEALGDHGGPSRVSRTVGLVIAATAMAFVCGSVLIWGIPHRRCGRPAPGLLSGRIGATRTSRAANGTSRQNIGIIGGRLCNPSLRERLHPTGSAAFFCSWGTHRGSLFLQNECFSTLKLFASVSIIHP